MTSLTIHARPGARRDTVTWDPWRRQWTVACRAPPREGQANEALLCILAEALSVPRQDLSWVRGTTGREKVLEVRGLSAEEIHRRLSKGHPTPDGKGQPRVA